MKDAEPPSSDDPARLFDAQRRKLLRTVLGSVTVAGLLVGGIYIVHTARVGTFPLRLLVFMVVLLLLPLLWLSQRWLSTRRVALLFITYLYAMNVYIIALAGLTPGVALLSVVTTLLAALFYGKKGMFISLGAVIGSLGVLGPLWISGAMWGALPYFNPLDPLVWVRNTVVLALLCGTLSFAFVSLIEKIEITTKDLSATLRREREERAAQLRLREALERSQRMQALGQLAAGLAHDIGNSLMVLGTAAELVGRDPDATPRIQKLIAQMEESLATTSDTLNQMRYLGRAALQPARVASNEPIGWLERSLRSVLPPSIALRVSATSARDLHVDGSRLQQALLNLALNARDAMPHGGELSITAIDDEVGEVPPGWQAAPGDYVVVSIRDTGTGMDPVTLERIFEPLFTTKGERGTGLGLAMVRTFVHDAGGFIVVESSPGRGTSMGLYLPALRPAAEAPALVRPAVATT